MNSKLSQTKEEANQTGKAVEEALNPKNPNIFKNTIESVGDKIDSFKNKMSRMIGTAFVFSLLRSGLNNLRNGFISLLKTDDTFNASLNQIKANLMTAFTPIYNACLPAIRTLMNALAKLTGTIAMFISGIFGKSIADSTKQAKGLSKAMNSTASGSSKVVKNAQKIAGALSSIDNLEVLTDNSSSGSGGAGGTSVPSANADNGINFDGELTYSQKLLDILNKVYGFIKDNKTELLSLGAIFAGVFAAYKVAKFIGAFAPLVKVLKTIGKLFVTTGEDGEKSFNNIGTGITVAIAGFVMMISNVVSLIKNWDTLTAKEKTVKIAFAAIGAAAIALGYAIAAGISAATLGLGAIIALVATLITTLATLTIKFFTEKDAILSTAEAQEQLNEATKAYQDANDSYVNAIDKADSASERLRDIQRKTGISGEELYKKVRAGTLDYKNMTAKQKEVYKAYLENDEAQKLVKESSEALAEAKKQEELASWNNQLAIAAETDNYEEYKKSVVEAFEKGELSADEARDLIEKSMSRMSTASGKTFTEDLPDDIKEGLDPDKYKTKRQKFENWFSDTVTKIKNWFTDLFTKTIPQKIDDLKEKIKTFFKKTLPNLAIAGVETLINKIIGAFEKLINIPIKSINGLIETANDIPGVKIKKFSEIKMGRVEIPRLAEGTVIPPRHKFIAELGDQKHGTNIEAPLETIKQANREVMTEFLDKIGALGNQEKEIVLRNLQFIIQLGTNSFQKVVVDALRLSEKELGKQLLVS